MKENIPKIRLITANIEKTSGKANLEAYKHIKTKMIKRIPPIRGPRNSFLSVGSDIINRLFTFL